MRILFVDQTSQLGGAELCLKDIVLARGGGDRVFLFQHGPLEQLLQNAGVEVLVHDLGGKSQDIRKQSGLLSKLGAARAVYRLARAVATATAEMDVIYANTPKALVVAALASWLARKPLVYHLHDILSLEHFSRSNLWLLVGLANRRAAQVIANSESSRTAFLAAGGKAPVSVCYNGFDCQPFDAWQANRSEIRRQLRSSWQLADQPLIGVFGRFAPWKGQHVAIDAMRQLPGVHLLLVGDALFGEEEFKTKLLTMAGAAELAGRIHFLGFRDDVGELMQAVDVVAHCSTAPEPFGRVIVEAMLSRRPIVASRAGGAMEIIEHGVSGLLAEPGDASDLAAQLKRLLDNTRDQTSRIEAGYASAKARFEIHSVVRQIEDIVDRCLC